jgi:glutamyl-tRNA reductase
VRVVNDRSLEIALVGTSHRLAGVEHREPLHAMGAAVRAALADRPSDSAIAEGFVLATCHRAEIYLIAHDMAAAEAELAARLHCNRGVGLFAGVPSYRLTGEAAIAHLCRVTAGLDSLILGEAEISGQVRRAAAAARENGSLGVYLDRVVAGALGASGRVRSETHLAEGASSAGAAAVALAGRLAGGLSGRRVLVVGAGDAARLAIARLARDPAIALTIASRSAKHARDAATAFTPDAEVIGLDAVAAALPATDVVMAAVNAASPIVHRDHVQRAIDARDGRPIVFVDISMPRAIDPAVADVDGAVLRTVDDLGDVVAEVAARRRREVPGAEAIVRDEAVRTYDRFLSRARRQRAAVA